MLNNVILRFTACILGAGLASTFLGAEDTAQKSEVPDLSHIVSEADAVKLFNKLGMHHDGAEVDGVRLIIYKHHVLPEDERWSSPFDGTIEKKSFLKGVQYGLSERCRVGSEDHDFYALVRPLGELHITISGDVCRVLIGPHGFFVSSGKSNGMSSRWQFYSYTLAATLDEYLRREKHRGFDHMLIEKLSGEHLIRMDKVWYEREIFTKFD